MIVVVSGLPRSGTSMMMQMLEAGGLEVVTDWQRQPDENNPRGYYELEDVKDLINGGSVKWLDDCEGKAVKIISSFLEYLPLDRGYKILYMCRPISEVAESQEAMIERLNKVEEDLQFTIDEYKAILYAQTKRAQWWIEENGIEALYMDYHLALDHPYQAANAVNTFCDGHLSVRAMAGVPDPNLHRHHAAD